MRTSYITGDEVIAGNWHPEQARVLAHRDRLAAQRGVLLGNGDKYVVDGNDVLIQIAEGPTTSEMSLVSTATAAPPQLWLNLLHGYVRAFAALWRRAAYVASIHQDVDPNAWIAGDVTAVKHRE